ncbi:MAG: hypothetical protein AB2392_14100, partial [Neobacillus sp.]
PMVVGAGAPVRVGRCQAVLNILLSRGGARSNKLLRTSTAHRLSHNLNMLPEIGAAIQTWSIGKIIKFLLSRGGAVR